MKQKENNGTNIYNQIRSPCPRNPREKGRPRTHTHIEKAANLRMSNGDRHTQDAYR